MSIKINNEEIGECFYRVIFDGLSFEYKSMPLEKKRKDIKRVSGKQNASKNFGF